MKAKFIVPVAVWLLGAQVSHGAINCTSIDGEPKAKLAITNGPAASAQAVLEQAGAETNFSGTYKLKNQFFGTKLYEYQLADVNQEPATLLVSYYRLSPPVGGGGRGGRGGWGGRGGFEPIGLGRGGSDDVALISPANCTRAGCNDDVANQTDIAATLEYSGIELEFVCHETAD